MRFSKSEKFLWRDVAKMKRYTFTIIFWTEDNVLAHKIIDHVQTEYAIAWDRNHAYGKITPMAEDLRVEDVQDD
jgi:hypothetical protein